MKWAWFAAGVLFSGAWVVMGIRYFRHLWSRWRYIQWYERAERGRRGLCVWCGYDLTGNESGVCPECGAVRR
jgi:hypothetical protein